MGATKAFIYSNKLLEFDYGSHHPLRIERLKLTYDLIDAYGLLGLPDLLITESAPATRAEIEKIHRSDYIEILRSCSRPFSDPEAGQSYGLGPGDNPVFPGLWDWSVLTTGASLRCGRLVADGRAAIGFNMAGGLHHAMPARASGFCYINDLAVTIADLVERGLKVAYLDLDAHHGDGVQQIFYDTDRVLTISLHQHGRGLFPGTGHVFETGRNRGQGYAVNIPLYARTDDQIFLEVFHALVPDLLKAYRPDILVTQLGVDTFRTDPLAGMCLTTNGFVAMVRTIKDLTVELDLPWVAMGGGGYNIVNVARAWTLAWAEMNDVVLPDDLPESFVQTISRHGYREKKLRDNPGPVCKDDEVRSIARQVIQTVRETLLSVIARNSRNGF